MSNKTKNSLTAIEDKPTRVPVAQKAFKVPMPADRRASRWIRGPRPVVPYYVTHPMEMECTLCTFVLIECKLGEQSLWELKYVNRQCRSHVSFAGPQEIT